MKWLVSGTWEKTGKAGEMNVEAESMREAYADAKMRGLIAMDAMVVRSAAPPKATTKPRVHGLSFGESQLVLIVGLCASPALIGIPLAIWGFLAYRRHGELRAVGKRK